MTTFRFSWAAAAAVAIVLAAGAAACGDDDGSAPVGPEAQQGEQTSQPDGDPTPSARSDPPAADSEAEREIRGFVNEQYDVFLRGDAEATCAVLTAEARKRFVTEVQGERQDCVDRFRGIYALLEEGVGRESISRPRILSIAIDGDRAEVLVRQGRQRQSTLKLVREEDGWKSDIGRLTGSVPTSP